MAGLNFSVPPPLSCSRVQIAVVKYMPVLAQWACPYSPDDTPGEDRRMAADTTPLRDAAVQLHEAWCEFVRVGFTEEQALQIVIGMATRGNN